MGIGGNGRFQKMAAFSVIGGIQAFTVVLYNIAFIEISPQFKCKLPGTNESFDCVEADFCGRDDIEFWIDRDNLRSINNWSEQIGLICRPSWQIGLLGSAFFAGWVCTILWVAPLASTYGRVRIFFVNCFIALIAYTFILLSRSYLLTLSMMFIYGATTTGRLSVGWPYLAELIGKKYRPLYATTMNAVTAVNGICGALYFLYVSQNSYYYATIGWAIQLLALVVCYNLPESPVWYIHKGMLAEAEMVL